MNCKDSFYTFLMVSKCNRIPVECVRHLFQYLVGVQAYMRMIIPCFRQLSHLQPSELSDCIGKQAIAIDCDLTDKKTEPCYFNGMIGSLQRYSPTQYSLSYFPVHEALFIENLDDDVVKIIQNVLQPSTMLTPESFAFYYKDPSLLPYAAFVSGLQSNFFFYFKLRAPEVLKSSLYHFVLLGMLSANSSSLVDGRFGRDDELLLDVLRFIVSTRNKELLYRMEVKTDYLGANKIFIQELILNMIYMEGYNRPLHPKTLRNENVLLIVLHRLLREGKATKELVSKYECMVNLNVKSEAFRFDFHSMLKGASFPLF
jgi:hypothetical protein